MSSDSSELENLRDVWELSSERRFTDYLDSFSPLYLQNFFFFLNKENAFKHNKAQNDTF